MIRNQSLTSFIVPYLTFNGNCREAMTFYHACLGGELVFQTVGDSPLSEKMPHAMKHVILHSSLHSGNLTIMASDMVDEKGLRKGNAVSLMLTCSSEEDLHRCYYSLSKGGTKDHPPEQTFRGNIFGDLTDKFGNHWLLNCSQTKAII